MKEYAKKYLSIGFSIMPLGNIIIEKNGSKKINYPKEGWKQYQTKKVSNEEIDLWTYPNLGVITGKISNLLVLDVDEYKENYDKTLFKILNIPITPVQKTGRGGKQYFFKHPGVDIRNDVSIGQANSCIDIRADGGMCIIAPSETSVGGKYEWILDPFETPLAPVPNSLLEILKNKTEGTKKSKPLSALISIPEGAGRNNAMASIIGKLCYSIKDSKNWLEEIYPVIHAINKTYLPPLSKQELFSIYTSVTHIESTRRKNLLKTEIPKIAFKKAMTFSYLKNQKFPEAKYIIKPFFEEGGLNMVSAPPNTWKSWLLFFLTRHIVTGEMVWDKFRVQKCKVMIVNEEDSCRLIQDRFNLLSIEDESLEIYFHIMEGIKMNEETTDNLIAELKENNIKVIIFDSLRALHNLDENDSKQMQGLMDLFKKFNREDITVIFTHHHRKKAFGEKNDGAESARGSSAISAALYGHISLDEEERDNGTFIVIHHLKSKFGEKEKPVEFKVIREGGRIDFKYEGNYKDQEKKKLETKEAILKDLKPMEWKSINDFVELGVASINIVRDAAKELVKEKRLRVITRSLALAKGIPVHSEGKSPKENIYSLQEDDFKDFN